MTLSIHQIPTGKWRENCYIVFRENKNALIIDPGSDADTILKFIIDHNLKALAILNTHGHFDHIGAVALLKEKFGIPFYLHSGDFRLVGSANFYRKLFDGDAPIVIPEVDQKFDDLGSGVEVCDFQVSILLTPGHTPGSVCLKIEDCLFTGDTLFRGTVGTTKLPGGNAELLKQSLRSLSLLSPETRIYSGHGRPTLLKEELLNNEEFKQALL